MTTVYPALRLACGDETGSSCCTAPTTTAPVSTYRAVLIENLILLHWARRAWTGHERRPADGSCSALLANFSRFDDCTQLPTAPSFIIPIVSIIGIQNLRSSPVHAASGCLILVSFFLFFSFLTLLLISIIEF